MDTFRYTVALLLVLIVPAIFVYWFLLHTLLPVWRRLGGTASMILLWRCFVAAAVLVSLWRGALLWNDYGFNPLCTAVGVICLAGAAVFRLQIERFFPWQAQTGLPEIDPEHRAQKLVTEGPYAHTRNPRYVQIFLALIGWAFLANYAAGYLFALMWAPLAAVIVYFEERELSRRFGPEYESYRERVARFWPHAAATNHRVKA
ncbi:MAG: methyltransferase family protein [Chthoniobacterales bacterium]